VFKLRPRRRIPPFHSWRRLGHALKMEQEQVQKEKREQSPRTLRRMNTWEVYYTGR